MYKEEYFDNDVCPVRWKDEHHEADFFDIRYKGKKWSMEEISKDGKLLPKFSKWMMGNVNSPDFDWKEFSQENGYDNLFDCFKNTSDFNLKMDDDCLYITKDNVLGIKIKRLQVRWTYWNNKKNKNSRNSYRDSYYNIFKSEKGEYYFYKYGSDDDDYKQTFHAYDFDGEKFTYTGKIRKPKI